jgi:4-hydroxy-tetrahydrodipicolinate synthase
VGLKDAASDVVGSSKLLTRTPEHFELYSGDDAMTLPLLAVGAVGVISVASHWAGIAMSEMLAAFARGDVVGARELNGQLVESFEFESSDEFPNPLPAKAACRALGLPAGQCRPPLGAAPDALVERAGEVVAHLGGASNAAALGARARSGA